MRVFPYPLSCPVVCGGAGPGEEGAAGALHRPSHLPPQVGGCCAWSNFNMHGQASTWRSWCAWPHGNHSSVQRTMVQLVLELQPDSCVIPFSRFRASSVRPEGEEVDVMTLLCALSLTYNSLVQDRINLLHDLTVRCHMAFDKPGPHLVSACARGLRVCAFEKQRSVTCSHFLRANANELNFKGHPFVHSARCLFTARWTMRLPATCCRAWWPRHR